MGAFRGSGMDRRGARDWDGMTTTKSPRRLRLYGIVLTGFCLSVTSGCAMLPPLIEHGYTVLSGISYLATSKGPSDHALSFLARKDCSLFRILRGQPICAPITENSNRPLLVTLREMFDGAPRDLAPSELLKQLPPPVNPSIPFDATIAASD
jgi:hypothetical protein